MFSSDINNTCSCSGMVQTRSQFEFCLTAVAEETHAILKSLAQ